MSDITIIKINPSYFLRELQNKKLNDLYWEWESKLPEGWIETFIEEGLLPFLNQYGYSVGFSKKELVNYCKSWAFGHVQLAMNKSKHLEVSLLKTKNTGGLEEYDWYTYTIPSDEWFELAEYWSQLEFFDETDAGESQKTDFPMFVWHLLFLEGSKAHEEYLYFKEADSFEQDEDTMHQPLYNEDQGAYGGDRRTL